MGEIAYPIGPWTIEKTSNGHGVYEKGWGFVAIHDKSCHEHWNKGQEARRALICAAPELLEALQDIVRLAMANWELPNAEQMDIAERALNAIKKARGES